MRLTKGFCGCDICGIGLGEFMFHERRAAEPELNRKSIDRWVKVKGEDKIDWTGGKITLRWLELNGNDLEWVTRTLIPNHVCPECEEKYIQT